MRIEENKNEPKPCKHGCGAMLVRQRKVSHEHYHCPTLKKPTVHRKCAWQECTVVFEVKPQHPTKAYCSKLCWDRKSRHGKKQGLPVVERKNPAPMSTVASEVELEELRMAPVRLREAEVALEARRLEAEQEERREKSYALWGSLLGFTLEAA